MSRQQRKDIVAKNPRYFFNLKNLNKRKYQGVVVIYTKTVSEPKSFKEKYHFFINSPFWKSQRFKFLKVNPNCHICGSAQAPEVHHISYENVFCSVPSESGDIVTLCRIHHQEFHDKYGLKKDMYSEWEDFKKAYMIK